VSSGTRLRVIEWFLRGDWVWDRRAGAPRAPGAGWRPVARRVGVHAWAACAGPVTGPGCHPTGAFVRACRASDYPAGRRTLPTIIDSRSSCCDWDRRVEARPPRVIVQLRHIAARGRRTDGLDAARAARSTPSPWRV